MKSLSLFLQKNAFLPWQWCVILIGFSVPISVAFDNVLLGLIFLGAIFSLKKIAVVVVLNPVARAAMVLFAMLFVAMFYGTTSLKEAFSILAKYIDLAFIPFFMFFLAGETARTRARYAFMVAMAVTLLASYLVGFEIVSTEGWIHGYTNPSNPAIFHSHITQNNMMAFAILLALLECRDATTKTTRVFWGMFAVLGTVNVLFMVQGRTGYLILLGLLGWFAWVGLARHRHMHGKDWGAVQAGIIALVLVGSAFVAYQTSARLHDRVTLVVSEIQAWSPNDGIISSTGERLNFYYNTLRIVQKNALFGVGTGGFPAAFEQQTLGENVTKTRNPHNEYLMISAQTGIIGLVLLLYLFHTHWRFAPMLGTALEQDAARGLLLAYVINCTLNSALMDHSDGLFFAFMTAVFFSNLKQGVRHD